MIRWPREPDAMPGDDDRRRDLVDEICDPAGSGLSGGWRGQPGEDPWWPRVRARARRVIRWLFGRARGELWPAPLLRRGGRRDDRDAERL